MPRKITAPIARSTAYDFNCHIANSHTKHHREVQDAFVKASDPESRHIMPHEFLFRSSRDMNHTRMKAMSSVNGLEFTRDQKLHIDQALRAQGLLPARDPPGAGECSVLSGPADIKQISDMWDQGTGDDAAAARRRVNRVLNRMFTYVGVAITGCESGAAGALQRQGFSATRGGLMTVIKTGKHTIPAGARVRLEFDLGDILRQGRQRHMALEGIPRNKIVPHLVVVHDDRDAVDHVEEGLRAADIRAMAYHEPVPVIPAIEHIGRVGYPLA